MILLLQGPSDVARISIAEKIVKERPDWRHIPVERIGEMVDMGANALGELFQGGEMQFIVACQCAKQLKDEENFHTVMTMEAAPDSLEDLRDELGEHFYAVHVGEDNESAAFCDYVIEGKKSVNAAYSLLKQLIEAVEAQEKEAKPKKKKRK